MTTAMAGPGPDASASKGDPEGASKGASDGAVLGDPELRRFLREYVKKRVQPADVDDVVQTVLVDALASTKRPPLEGGDPSEVRKWLVGIARHKCADVHRRAGRERPPEDDLPDIPGEAPPVEERALVRWAEEQALSTRDADKTLGWMAREGEGDKLEHIAEEEQLPAARVRQRVSRMRRFLKERWLAELALVAALGAICFVMWRWLRREDEGPIVADPTRPPSSASPVVGPAPERVTEGKRIRESALEACGKDEPQRCIEGLDRAKELDPEGDAEPSIGAARQRAVQQLEQDRQRSSSKSAPTNDRKPEDVQKGPDEPKAAPLPTTVPPSVPTGSLPRTPPKAPSKSPPNRPKDKESFLDLKDERSSPAPPVASSTTASLPAPAPAPPAGKPSPAKPPSPTKSPAPSDGDFMQQMTKGGKK